MGREVKRVPMDFDWPIGKIWVGYLNPYHSVKCPYCKNGYNPVAQEYMDSIYNIDGEHDWQENPYRKGECYDNNARFAHLTQDEIDCLISEKELPEGTTTENCLEKILRSAIPISWSGEHYLQKHYCEKHDIDPSCPHCKGTGEIFFSEEVERLADEWEPRDPPKGEGWQLWETTSEGSPITPVFATAEELAAYCADQCTVFANFKKTKEDWLAMFREDFICHEQGNVIFM